MYENVKSVRSINGTKIWAQWHPWTKPYFRLFYPFAWDSVNRVYFFRHRNDGNTVIRVKENNLYTKYFRPFCVDTTTCTYYPVDILIL